MRALVSLVVVAALGACARPDAPVSAPPKQPPAAAVPRAAAAATSFAVVALSRGRGVPAEAREGLKRVSAMVEEDRARGVRVESRSERIGLEGETRLCVEYESAAEGRRAMEKAEQIARGVDLLRVEAGPCR